MKLFDQLMPPDNDPTLTIEQRDLKERERRHFLFAGVLIIGCMLLLPIAGTIYIILMKLGVIASPFRP